jgi:hypothetical protein
MPVWRLIYSNDFSGYSNEPELDADFSAPHHFPQTSTDWGLTYGPDGQPGIRNQTVGTTGDSGGIVRRALAPTCRGFRVKGRFNFANTGGILTIHGFCYITNSDGGDALVQVARVHATSTLRTIIQTTAPFSTTGDPLRLFVQDNVGAIPATPTDFELQGERSTITETSPGVFAPNNDGWVKVFINSVELVNFTGPVWNDDSSFNPTPYWNEQQIQTIGAFSEWEIYDNTDCEEEEEEEPPGTSESDPCRCVDPVDPGETSPGDAPPENPYETFSPPTLSCVGGGTVPTVADPTDSEIWASL